MAYVYRHIRLDKNVPFYIGMSKNDDDYVRAYTKNGRHKHWGNIVSKTEYEVEILIDNASYEEAISCEIFFIKLYGRKDLKTGTLCNKTDGGEGTKNPSEEFRKKISELKKGNTYMKGKKLPESAKQTLSQKGKLRPPPILSQEAKNKIGIAHKGKKLSAQHKKQLSDFRKGKPAHNKGKPMPIHQYEWMLKNAVKKKVAKYTIGGIFLNSYESVNLAAKSHSIGQGNITNACNKRIMYGGYLWRYFDDRPSDKIDSHKLRITPVIQLTMEGIFVAEYPNAMQAAKTNGWDKTTILRASKRENNTAYNFKWHKKL